MNLDQTNILLILHIVFLSFFLGGQLYYLFILQPASYQFFSTNDQVRFLQNVLRRQNPVLLLALCLVVVSGGFMITPLKTSLGANYFSQFGTKLISKLGVFFIVFFVTCYQTLGIGFKIRYLDPAHQLTGLKEKLNQVRLLMSITAVLNIIITAIVVILARQL